MRNKAFCPLLAAWVVVGWLVDLGTVRAQGVKFEEGKFEAVQVAASVERLEGKEVLKVVKDAGVKDFNESTFARIKGVEFGDGTIEVAVRARLVKAAPEFARGFIGVAFRISDDNKKFECIHLRPANGRAEDQLRRNHSIQYFSAPEWKFDRLRKEAAGVYETYADMGLDEWITMRIEVKGKQARLYLNGGKQPALLVNDLKSGADARGGVGLWVDVGTEGYFSDLKVRAAK